jgi:hypothetical protein
MKKKIIISILIFIMLIIPFNATSINIKYDSKDPIKNGCLEINQLDDVIIKTYDSQNQLEKIYSQSTNDIVISLIQKINENLYLGYLENLTSFGPRLTTTQACDDSAKYIYDEFKKLDLETRYHNWSNDYLYGSNIEATLPGSDENSDEIYIICAHYDSVEGSPGADDDGSGVAAVMTAANVMSLYSFNHTIKFVAFSGEEQGLYGSGYYVEEAINKDDNIIAVLNIDMIGFAPSEEDESIVEIYEDDESEWLAEFTVDISQEYREYFDLEIMRSGYSWGSDHYRFWEGGYNAIFYAEYNFNDFYHSPEDTIDKMNLPYATRVSKLIISTLAELSEIAALKNAPLKPNTPTGPINGKIGVEYNYSTSTTDVDGDIIYYFWSWGDNTNDEWIGPYSSGEEIIVSHIWEKRGEYSIKVKAKDENGFESPWSDPLETSMPRNNQKIKQNIINKIENFNIIYKILQNIFY